MSKIIKKAFTLAEVLLVVAILGAVSVLTIPNLKNNTSEETNITALKSTYGQLETALSTVISEYGSLQETKDSCSSSTDGVLCLNQRLINSLDLQLNCENSNLSRCYSSEVLKNIDGGNIASGASNARCSYAFTLSNGASICYVTSGNNYEIDVNGGKKGPNVVGIDVFETYLSTNGDLSYDNPSLNIINRGKGGGFTTGRDETAWVMIFGNMDYLKCKSSLVWNTKTTCDNN